MSSPFAAAIEYTFRHVQHYLEQLSDQGVDATCSYEELLRRFDGPLADEGIPAERVIDELARDVEGGLTAVGSGRFFGWVVGGVLPAALGADILAATWDQTPGVYTISPAAAVVEEVCGRWLLEVFELPRESSFALVTGCQMAHVTCLAAARNSLLAERGWDVERQGLFGAPRIRLVSGELHHGTVARAVRLLGLGTDAIETVPCTDRGSMDAERLEAILAQSDQPTIVVVQAGEVNTGAFDPFVPIIAAARRHGAWVHVDGAFGLWARASAQVRDLAQGVELADSWATDGHKWLNVPYDCGYAFVAHPAPHRRAFAHEVHYLMQSDSHRDAIDWTPEHSRRARCFATYAALRSLGRLGVDELVERCCAHARALVEGAARLPGVEVVHFPTLNQGLLRFLDERPGASVEDSDRRTIEVIQAIARSGEALFTSTRFLGRVCMRVSVSNWSTNAADVDRVLLALGDILSESGAHGDGTRPSSR